MFGSFFSDLGLYQCCLLVGCGAGTLNLDAGRLRDARESGAFRSVGDVVDRSGLGPAELRVLSEAGAFESLLRAAGVTADSRIVVYWSGGQVTQATRLVLPVAPELEPLHR